MRLSFPEFGAAKRLFSTCELNGVQFNPGLDIFADADACSSFDA